MSDNEVDSSIDSATVFTFLGSRNYVWRSYIDCSGFNTSSSRQSESHIIRNVFPSFETRCHESFFSITSLTRSCSPTMFIN